MIRIIFLSIMLVFLAFTSAVILNDIATKGLGLTYDDPRGLVDPAYNPCTGNYEGECRVDTVRDVQEFILELAGN